MAAKKGSAKKPASRKVSPPKKAAPKRGASQTASTRKSGATTKLSGKAARAAKMSAALTATNKPVSMAKVKTIPYSKMVNKKPSRFEKTISGIGDAVLPLNVVANAMQAITGVDFHKGLYDSKGNFIPPSKRKGSRLGGLGAAATEAALYYAPLGKGIKKVRSAFRSGKSLNEVTKKSRTGTKATISKTRQIG